MTGVREVGARVEKLLATLRSDGGPAMAAAAEELVGLLVGLYGDGLRHIVAALRADGDGGAALLDGLTEDPLVESLLILHDLHPLDVSTRIQRALDRIRPYLGSHAGGVEFLGVTEEGAARLRLEGSCNGCPSSTLTVRLAIRGAVEQAAPEVTDVIVEGVTEAPAPQLLSIGRRPPQEADGPPGDPGWVSLPDSGPPTGRPVVMLADGVPVLVCSLRGTLYAYRDACPACGSSLAGGVLDAERLRCPGCGARYDVRSAGRGLDDPASHLDPLPLLADSQGVRVAVPNGVAS
jgi:Fe-S cluster biogenesis protein NfuA/nitrite reductase/ring-hydroxylating ferredoxin subunit